MKSQLNRLRWWLVELLVGGDGFAINVTVHGRFFAPAEPRVLRLVNCRLGEPADPVLSQEVTMTKTFTTLALCALLTGCLEPTPTKTETKDAQALVDAMTFVRHRSGLCFGVTTVEKVSTGGHFSMSVAVVQVDCAAAGLAS